jgi:hypothetical protein
MESAIPVEMNDRIAQLTDEAPRAPCQRCPIEDDMSRLPCLVYELGRPDRDIGGPFP